MTREHLDDITGYLWSQFGKLCGLVAAVAGALVMEAAHVGEPWHWRLTVISIGAAAACAYAMRPFDRRDQNGNLPPR